MMLNLVGVSVRILFMKIDRSEATQVGHAFVQIDIFDPMSLAIPPPPFNLNKALLARHGPQELNGYDIDSI